MKKHIVLLYPRPTGGYATERRRDIHAVRRMYAPLSVMYLAAALEEAGFPVIVLGQRLMETDEMLTKVAAAGDILFFGISSMTGSQITNGLAAARLLRDRCGAEVPIVWGGVHPSIYPQGTITHPLVDIIVRSEDDEDIAATVKLCRDFKRINPSSRMALYQYMPYPGAPLTDLRIRRLIGDLGSIPRATRPQYKNKLNERLDENLIARFRDRIFI